MRRLLVLAAGVVGLAASPAPAATISVTTTADGQSPDGRCGLREAITSANHDAAPFPGEGECASGNGADAITIPIGTLERAAFGADDDNLVGDLDVTSTITITGAGAALTTIDATNGDRVFDVQPTGTLTLQGMTITGGRASDGVTPGLGSHGTNGGAHRSHDDDDEVESAPEFNTGAHAIPVRDPEAVRASMSSHFSGVHAARSHAQETRGTDNE